MLLKSSSYDASLTSSIIKAKDDFFNLDNYCTTVSFPIDSENNIVFTSYEILKKYENILLENSVWMKLEDQYKYRPEYLSHMLYDTIHLWYLILFLNKFENCYQFDRDKIRVIHPNNLGILNEIYSTESSYLKSTNYSSNALQLKSLYDKSDNIIKTPNFSIGNPGNIIEIDTPTNDGNIGFSQIQYNLSRAYLTLPIDNTRPNGLIYSSNYVTGTILSKDEQIVSIKPMYVGGSAKVYINNELMLECPSNVNEFNILKSKSMSRMNVIMNHIHEISEGVSWYNPYINGLLIRIKSSDFNNINLKKEIRVKLHFEGGTTIFSKETYTANEVTFPVDISSNYGELESLTISVHGDLIINEKPINIDISYLPCEFKYTNILLDKNTAYTLKIESTNMNEFYPMISYSFKDYKIIDREDLITQTIYNNLGLIPTTASPSNIIINNSTVFKGLNLISLIDPNELDGIDLFENHLEDNNNIDIEDKNDKLLLYETYSTTNRKITDYFISGSLYCRNNISKINGSMGIFIKGKSEEGKVYAYIYIMKMKNEYTDKPKSLLHGLYKLDPKADNIYLDSDELNFSNLTKISDTPQYISGNMENPTFFKIVTNNNNIKIYDGNSQRPIIDYYDSEQIKFNKNEQPMFGLAMFNIRNPGYMNLVVMGKDSSNI